MKVLTIDEHLGKDAAIMQTPKGTEFVSITLANTTYIKGEDKTVWYDVTFLNVDSLRSRLQYLKKGTYVAVSGLPDDSGYVRKDGKIKITLSSDSANEQCVGVYYTEKALENSEFKVNGEEMYFDKDGYQVFDKKSGYIKVYDNQRNMELEQIDEKKIKARAVSSRISYCKNHNIGVDV